MSADTDVIRDWFDTRAEMNYGVCPGPDHVIIDLDVKESVSGVDALLNIQAEQDVLDWIVDETFTVQTPSGGRHVYLTTEFPVSNSHGFPSGIDVRGAHGYVVGPGCVVNEKTYGVVVDAPALPAPEWVRTRLRRRADVEHSHRDPLFELDSPEAFARAREFLMRRDPAIKGLGGDRHTLMTAMCLIDLGLSEVGARGAMTEPFVTDDVEEKEPRSWNDRCMPPWDVHGRRGTLEEKVRNAWRYREREPGSKGGGVAFDDDDLRDVMAAASPDVKDGDEGRLARIFDHLFRGGSLFKRGKRREFVIPEWLPAHGLTANLARRGGGKTVIMIDMALRIACDMDWHGYQIKPGFHVVYICGEDDEGAEEQVRAWCQMHGVDEPPERFLFLDIITDLMSAEDVREWAEALRRAVGRSGRAVLFLDTWQRASSRGGQNKDDDMQLAVHHVEALARSLNGPAVVAFHPPKHDEKMVMGSSVIENSTIAIWIMTDHASGKKMEVTRMKGRGVGNYQMFKFEEIGLGEKDDFGRERTGVVPIKLGGVDGGGDEGEYAARRAFANVMREIELRRKDNSPDSNKHYATTKMAKIIVDELPDRAIVGDEWAVALMDELRDAGTINFKSWQRMNERIIELFGTDPRGHDFGDGFALRLYRDGKSRRVRIDRSGISS